MGRELRLFIRLLRNAPHNPVFRSTLAGRNARTMMIALLILAFAHVGVLEWIERSPLLRFAELSGFVSRLTWHSLLLPFMLMACVLGIRRGISLDQRRELWLTVQAPREVAFGALLAPALFMAVFTLVIPLLISVNSFVESRLWWQGVARDLLQMGLIDLLEEYGRALMNSRGWEFYVFFSLWVVVAYIAYAGLLTALLLGMLVRCRMPVWVEFLRIPVHVALVLLLVSLGCIFTFDVMVDVVRQPTQAVILSFVTLGFMGIWSLFAIVGALLGLFHGMTYGAGRRWFVEAVPDLGRGIDWFESEWIVQESASRGIPRALLEWLFPYTRWELSQAAVRAVMGAAFGGLLIATAFASPWGLGHQIQNAGLNRIVIISAICLLAAALFAFPRKPLILPLRPLQPIAGRLLPSMVLTSFVAGLFAFAIANVCWFLAAPDRAAFLVDVHDNRLILLIAYASMLVVTTMLMMGLNLLLRIRATRRRATLLVVANLALLVVPMVFTARLLVLACVSIGTATLLGLVCYMLLGGGKMLLQMMHDDEARYEPLTGIEGDNS